MQGELAAVPGHVPLKVDDHPADGGPDVPRRGDSYWGGRHSLSLALQIIPGGRGGNRKPLLYLRLAFKALASAEMTDTNKVTVGTTSFWKD